MTNVAEAIRKNEQALELVVALQIVDISNFATLYFTGITDVLLAKFFESRLFRTIG